MDVANRSDKRGPAIAAAGLIPLAESHAAAASRFPAAAFPDGDSRGSGGLYAAAIHCFIAGRSPTAFTYAAETGSSST